MIDTHSHIYLPEFDDDRPAMLLRANDAGIKKIFLPNIDKDSINIMLELCSEQQGFCFPMMGLHPCSVKQDFESQLKIVEENLFDAKIKFYGIGECGLDYYWDKSFISQQKFAFEFQIELAKKLKLPLSIHSREATADCIELIAKHKNENLQGVFHCFSGTQEQLDQIIDLGFYAGIGGVVTFKNGGLDKILQPRHLNNLVLETDAPYLAPVPFRGKRNEPAYLEFVVKKLVEILGVTENSIRETTSENARNIFKV